MLTNAPVHTTTATAMLYVQIPMDRTRARANLDIPEMAETALVKVEPHVAQLSYLVISLTVRIA